MNKWYVDTNKLIINNGQTGSVRVLDESNGCVAGCNAGITFYTSTEYGKGGKHKDQEGFYVLEGAGMAKFGEEEFEVHEGMAMIVPAGVWHCIKRNQDSVPVKVFWFHAAI